MKWKVFNGKFFVIQILDIIHLVAVELVNSGKREGERGWRVSLHLVEYSVPNSSAGKHFACALAARCIF